MYGKLKALFGYEHDLTDACPNSVFAPITIEDSDEEQEVNSPRECIRKCLFGEPDEKPSRVLVSVESHTLTPP